jgi:polyisoprenoid-binding protein YceI
MICSLSVFAKSLKETSKGNVFLPLQVRPPALMAAARASIIFLFGALFLAMPFSLAAASTQYSLDAEYSHVGFTYTLGGSAQKGSMPVAQAKIIVDPANLAASRVDISLNVKGVRTALPFARPALIGPSVLDAVQFPTIRFISTAIQLGAGGRLSEGAKVSGNLTIHGVTHPVTFDASVFRARGSAKGDLSALTVHLTGQISRSAFGATGFRDLVADTVGLDITAAIREVK